MAVYATDLSNLFLGYDDLLGQIPVATVSSVIVNTSGATGSATSTAYTHNFYSTQANNSGNSTAPIFFIGNGTTVYNYIYVTIRSGYTMGYNLGTSNAGINPPTSTSGTINIPGTYTFKSSTNTFFQVTSIT